MKKIINTDVGIIGGGIVGTNVDHILGYTKGNISSVLIERQPKLGQLNSYYTQNSQTLHVGDIESTMKKLEKIKQVKQDAGMMETFFLRHADLTKGMYRRTGKMLMGVGEKECDIVTHRKERLTDQEGIFPDNRLLSREQIAQMEPILVKGRDPKEQLVAYYGQGYAVDFGAMCGAFAQVTQQMRGDLSQVLLGTGVKKILRTDDSGQLFDTILDDGTTIRSKAVIIAAGGYTPVLLKELGYGEDIGILAIAANYYRIKPSAQFRVTNKVYMIQEDGLPNAALHLDPEENDPSIVRLGPTAFGIPYLEKKKWTSFFDYMGILDVKRDLSSFMKIMSDPLTRDYMLKNYKFLIPIYGKRLFLKEARKIIPSLKFNDIEIIKDYGGTRTQVIDRTTHTMNYGEATIYGKNENILGLITPSPGASTATGNAVNTVQKILTMPGFDGYEFDHDRLVADYPGVYA